MRTLLLAALALAAVFFGLPGLYDYGSSPRNYFRALDTKMAAQAKVLSPRVLLVGGSNLVFGMDSERLSKRLGIPVYNLGFHADLGIPFMLQQAEAAMRPGDMVLFSYEYKCRDGSLRTVALAGLESPGTQRYIRHSLNDRLRLVTLQSQVVLNGLVNTQLFGTHSWTDIYRADGFNAYGDLTTHLNAPQPDFWIDTPLDTALATVQPSMDRFVAEAARRGVQAYYLPPPYPDSAYHLYHTSIEQIGAKMRARGWQQICPARQMIFGDTVFFDTPNHLTALGRRQRTDRLAAALAPVLARRRQQTP